MINVNWHNEESKELHEDSFRKAQGVYTELEILSVEKKVRKCALIGGIRPGNLDAFQDHLNTRGLIAIPISKDAIPTNGEFGHVSVRPAADQPFTYRLCVGTELDEIMETVEYYNNNDDEGVGKMLGYPECCTKFFAEEWRQGHFDPIVPSFLNSTGITETPNQSIKKIIMTESPVVTSHLRYAGIRVIPHFACSMDCEASHHVAQQWIELGREENVDGLEECLNLLNSPTETIIFDGKIHISFNELGLGVDDVTEKHDNPIIIKTGGATDGFS